MSSDQKKCRQLSTHWIELFNQSLKTGSTHQDNCASLFLANSFWRDALALSWQLHTIIGSLEIDYRDDNIVEQGFVFKRLGSGQMCGCGESFTPLGSTAPLGW